MASKRVCRTPGCPTLVNADAYRGMCDQCRRAWDKARGSSTQRGYGSQHQAERRRWQDRIDAGEPVHCWRPNCGNTITGRNWHLGHDDHDRTITRGPECAQCNTSWAGRMSHQ